MSTKTSNELEVEIVHINPKTAEQMLTKNLLNREMSDKTITKYALAMSEGEWRLSPEAIAFCDPFTDDATGQKYPTEVLIDGQQRLAAVIKSGKTIQFLVIRHCDPRAFAVIGTGRPRSQKNILEITRRDLKNPGTVATILSSFLRYGLDMHGTVDSWMIRRLLKRLDEDIKAVVTYKQKLKGLAQRQVLAALLMAEMIDPEKTAYMVQCLPKGLAGNGSRLSKDDPASALRDYLYDHISSSTRDTADAYFLKCCSGVAAVLANERGPKLQVNPDGLAWLRSKAKDRLSVLLGDIHGRTPSGFYSPRLPQKLIDAE